jgi:hypothetical protein
MSAQPAALCLALASSSAFALAADAPSQPARQTVIYAGGGRWPAHPMARIDVRAPGQDGHALTVFAAHGPMSKSNAPRQCSPPRYRLEADADLLELYPGTYMVTAKAALLVPPWAFEVRGEVTLEAGRCYEPVLTCAGDVRDGDACRLSLKRKRCAPLRSPRRIVMRGRTLC